MKTLYLTTLCPRDARSGSLMFANVRVGFSGRESQRRLVPRRLGSDEIVGRVANHACDFIG